MKNNKTKDDLLKENSKLQKRLDKLELSEKKLKNELADQKKIFKDLLNNEKSLKKRKQELNGILDNTYSLIFLKDLKSKYLLINKAFESMLKIKHSEIIGKNDYDLFSKETADNIHENDQILLNNKFPLMLYEEIPFKNKMFTFISNRFLLYDDEKNVTAICGIWTDITDLKQAEKKIEVQNHELQAANEELTAAMEELDATNDELLETNAKLIESDERYKRFTEVAFEGIVFHDKGVIVDVNSAYEEMFGYNKGEMIGMDILNTVTEDFRPILKQYVKENIEQYEGKAIRKDGSTFPAEVTAKEIVVKNEKYRVASIRDLTKIKKAEEMIRTQNQELIATNKDLIEFQKELTQRENRFTILAENINDMIWTVDFDFNVTFVSPSVERLTGFTIEETMNAPIEKRMTQDSVKYAFKILNAEMDNIQKGVSEPVTVELDFYSKDGPIIKTESTISILYDEQKQPLYILGVTRDITERKKVEFENEMNQSQLRQSQKMEAIGTLAGGIAHDFNNILSGIFGYTELALKKASESDPLRNYFVMILQAAKRAAGLVKQILILSRQQDQEQKPIHVSSIIEEALKLMRATLPSTIEIQSEIIAEEELILADATQIHQIIMNLCTNAAHAMEDEGGVIFLNLDNVYIDSYFIMQHSELSEGMHLKLEVSDTGHGIPKDILEKIFDPFFTTREKEEGTGLGLSVIHGIVKSHRGIITVYSEVGKGTTFKIYFPLDAGIHEQRQIEEKDYLPKGDKTILFVDDEIALVELGREMLKELGYRVITRTSSMEALHAFRSTPGKYDLVITDQTMPNMTGINMAKEMMKIRSDIPIILCTGFSEQVTSKEAKLIGIKKFLFKPVVLKDMAETVYNILNIKKEKINDNIEVINNLENEFANMTILIVDDQKENLELMNFLLEDIGCKTEGVSNGRDAVNSVKNNKFDLILMDINMPEMDGIEATEIIRKEINDTIPIIALTGSDIMKARSKCLKAGMNDLLSKPIRSAELNEMLRRWRK